MKKSVMIKEGRMDKVERWKGRWSIREKRFNGRKRLNKLISNKCQKKEEGEDEEKAEGIEEKSKKSNT